MRQLWAVAFVLLLASCASTTPAFQGVTPGGAAFTLDEDWLKACQPLSSLPNLVDPTALLKAHASDAASESYCRTSRTEIIKAYRSYRNKINASAAQ